MASFSNAFFPKAQPELALNYHVYKARKARLNILVIKVIEYMEIGLPIRRLLEQKYST